MPFDVDDETELDSVSTVLEFSRVTSISIAAVNGVAPKTVVFGSDSGGP